MPRSYYYLVAGLPDIILDNTKKGLSVTDFVDELSEQVHTQDVALFTILRLCFDNKNLINLLEKQEKELDNRGNFSRETLEQEIKIPEMLPHYMKTFIEAYKEGKFPFPELSVEDQLNWLFYEEITMHPNAFIREWFSFDLNLRNVLAGLNCKRFSEGSVKEEFTRPHSIICRNDVSELVLKSNAPDFSLSSRFSWVEKLLSFNQDNLVEYEKSIDTLRWEKLDELTTFTYFQIETILAFCIKLGMVERWQELDPEVGKEKLNKLLAELETSYTIMEEVK